MFTQKLSFFSFEKITYILCELKIISRQSRKKMLLFTIF